MRYVLLFIIFTSSVFTYGQEIYKTEDFNADNYFENIFVKKLSEDTLSSQFLIWVKDTVALHKHNFHTETIYVIEGEAHMYFNDEAPKIIKKGDVLFVPFNTWHAVKVISEEPLKVLSVQSPGFDGSDRIFKSNNEKHSDD